MSNSDVNRKSKKSVLLNNIIDRNISNNQKIIKSKNFSYETIREKSLKLLEIGKMN